MHSMSILVWLEILWGISFERLYQGVCNHKEYR